MAAQIETIRAEFVVQRHVTARWRAEAKRVLAALAERLEATARGQDSVSRVGGDDSCLRTVPSDPEDRAIVPAIRL